MIMILSLMQGVKICFRNQGVVSIVGEARILYSATCSGKKVKCAILLIEIMMNLRPVHRYYRNVSVMTNFKEAFVGSTAGSFDSTALAPRAR